MKYRLRPIEVEAIEMTAIIEISIEPGTTITCQVGDFLVRNPDGLLQIVPPEAFHVTYEACDPSPIFTEYKPKRRPRQKKVSGLGPDGNALLREMRKEMKREDENETKV